MFDSVWDDFKMFGWKASKNPKQYAGACMVGDTEHCFHKVLTYSVTPHTLGGSYDKWGKRGLVHIFKLKSMLYIVYKVRLFSHQFHLLNESMYDIG